MDPTINAIKQYNCEILYQNKKIAIKWLVYIVAAFSIYGLVVFNFGTAVRYKFPFILILVVGMAYELYLKHGIFFLIKETKL